MCKKLSCILLSLLLAFGQTLAICAEQAQRPTVEPDQIQQLSIEREVEYELSQLPLYDRYIVKLKPTNRLATAANTNIDMAVEAAIPAAKSAANTQVQEVLIEKQITVDAELFDLAETFSYTVDEQSAELLTVTLTEKVDAAAFTAELAGNAQIEYIQPDYTLQLASDVALDLDLSELTPTGTPVPAVTEPPEAVGTPEIGVEITPEQTPTPEATVEPEETVLPTPEATPTAVPIVAVIDAGIDVAHHGLIEQMLPGYDFVNNIELTYDFTRKSEYVHGTHVAGIIAQNAPEAQILPLKVFEHGRAYTSDVIRAIEYAQEHGASVVNMSSGSADDNRALREAMQERNMLFVCAAGNARTDVEEAPVYPACFDLENIISVASLNQDLGFSYYSNYGTESVDIAAVGRDVYSMWPEGEYSEMSGTSQAAAQVSAGAAEALARGDADAKAAVLERADRLAHLSSKVADGRSLNLFNVAAGVVSGGVQTVAYEEDFDVHGYEPTPEENWELFSSVETVDVAAGDSHVLVLKANGTVWSWGNNQWGKLGVNDWKDRSTPVRVIGLKNICSISATAETSYAIDEDGRVYEWGLLYLDGPGFNQIPFQRGTVEGAVTITGAGTSGASILCEDGTVYEWGISRDSTQNSDYTIRKRTGLTDIIAVSGLFALDSNGTIYERGMEKAEWTLINENSEFLYVHPVVTVGNVPGAVRFGANRTLITQSGDVWQIDYTRSEETVTYSITEIENLPNIEGIYGKNGSYFAKAKDGAVYVWGKNTGGILQTGTPNVDIATPQEAPDLTQLTRFAVSTSSVFAAHNNGDIYVWGDNTDGLIGTGDDVDFYDSPTPLSEPFADWMGAQEITIPCEIAGEAGTTWYTFVAPDDSDYIFSASGQSLAIFDDMLSTPDEYPYVHNWGNPTKVTDPYAFNAGERYYIQISADAKYTLKAELAYPPHTIAAGNGHSLVIDENGGILASGRGTHGQLGNGERVSSEVPVRVKDSTGTGYFTGAKSVEAGFLFSLALKEDGTLWTWGNATGFLTDTGDSHSDIPVQVVDESGEPLTNIVDISALGEHWVALDSYGYVWSWGANGSGQLGNGTTESVYTHAVKVPNLGGINQIAAGAYHSLAIRADDSLWAWGKNDNGQLGNQQTTNSSIPVRALGISNLKDIAAGQFHSMVLKHDGTVWTWGRNQYGQLGDGTRNSSTVPVQVKGVYGIGYLDEIIHIDAGIGYSMAVTEHETLYGWGHNNSYQLGDGTQQSSNLPTAMREELNRDLITFVKEVSCSNTATLVRTNSSVYICGTNTYGEFGNGTLKTSSALPLRAFTGTAEPLRITAEFQTGGTALDSLAPGAVTCNASVQNNQYIQRDALLVMKLWNKQTLIMEDVSMQPITVPSAGLATGSHEFAVPADAQNYQIELMVIDSIGNLVLLSIVVIFE